MFDGLDQFLPASVDVVCIDFSFQDAEEVFHGCVVAAIAFSRHALEDVVFFQHGLIGGHLVAPATIGVKGAAVGAGVGSCIRSFRSV